MFITYLSRSSLSRRRPLDRIPATVRQTLRRRRPRIPTRIATSSRRRPFHETRTPDCRRSLPPTRTRTPTCPTSTASPPVTGVRSAPCGRPRCQRPPVSAASRCAGGYTTVGRSARPDPRCSSRTRNSSSRRTPPSPSCG